LLLTALFSLIAAFSDFFGSDRRKTRPASAASQPVGFFGRDMVFVVHGTQTFKQ
jgi:hypothetical protein